MHRWFFASCHCKINFKIICLWEFFPMKARGVSKTRGLSFFLKECCFSVRVRVRVRVSILKKKKKDRPRSRPLPRLPPAFYWHPLFDVAILPNLLFTPMTQGSGLVHMYQDILESANFSLRIQKFHGHTFPYSNRICSSTCIWMHFEFVS